MSGYRIANTTAPPAPVPPEAQERYQPMRNIALKLKYDGSAYHGWQVQKT